MMARRQRFGRSHAVSGVFVFLLLGVFAVFSTLMALLGAQMYRGTVEQTQMHGEQRVISSYLLNVVRGYDAKDAVQVVDYDGIPALVLSMRAEDERYETRIYCFDGMLREQFAAAEDEFVPEYGEPICAAQEFLPERDGQLLKLRVVDGGGRAQLLHAALRCGGEVQP